MALGNNSGKNTTGHKGQIVKAIKERRIAKDYRSVTGSPIQGSAACGYSGSLSETYYFNGAFADPRQGDVMYASKRARSNNKMTAGYIKVFDGRSHHNIQIDTSGIVRRTTACP
tara:strand:+ start:57 stop:398 length:342 start_codon:yes stop_codon:yes gene_type:complete